MLEVEGLTKRYGARLAVDGVSFAVEEGAVVGFLGPNGAGKSTTLRMITGFLAPTGGRVRIAGVDAFREPVAARRLFGYMPEGVPLHGEMRTYEYLRFRAELKGLGGKAVSAAVERSLDQAGVADAADRIVGQLSKGYRQRVGLADALLTDPPLLILDEPTAGLDPNQIRQVRALIRGFRGKKAVFVSTHILPEVRATCDRVVIIDHGKKVGEGDPAELGRGGEAQRLRLRGPGAAEAFQAAARRAGATVEGAREDGGDDPVSTLELRLPEGPAAVDALFRAVVEAGLGIRALEPLATDLEDVFASLTTEDAEAAEAAEDAEGSADAAGTADAGDEAADAGASPEDEAEDAG